MKKVLITRNHVNAVIPTRGSAKAAGYDLYSTEAYVLKPGERKLFKTGLNMAIPEGMYGRIAPRSGLAFKKGIDTLAGVIDEDYRGDVGVILINLGNEDFSISLGDRIAQIIFEFYNEVIMEETASQSNPNEILGNTARGSGGFGSTDAKPINTGFVLKERTTVEKFFRNEPTAKVEMAKAYYANYHGEMYVYEENGIKGICVVDPSGTILTKTPIEKIK